MRRARAVLLACFAASCGGKVVIDSTGPSSSSSTGTGGATVSSTIFASTSFVSVGSTGGFATTDFAATTTGLPGSTGDVNPGCGSAQVSSDPMCQACAVASCCGELQACDVGTVCDALLGCLQMCGPGASACQMQCEAMDTAGVSDAQALMNCFDTSCGQNPACSTTGQTQICDSGLSTGKPACDACLGQDCCSQLKACVADSTCFGCLMGNMNPACATDALFNATGMCFMQCGSQCM